MLILEAYEGHVHRERDYASSPRMSGYRAIHVVVTEPEPNLKIEIQLRSKYMQRWADLVESLSSMFLQDFKSEGSHPVQEYMKLQSRMFAYAEEQGPALGDGELARLRRLRADVQELLDGIAVARGRE